MVRDDSMRIRTSTKRILNNSDHRRLVENFFSLASLKIANLILPFVTLPYLIRILGFEKYGLIVFALSLVQYFQSITDYGFNLSGTRLVAKNRGNVNKLRQIYTEITYTKFLLLAATVVALLCLFPLLPSLSGELTFTLLMSLILIGRTLFPEWFFRGVEEMKYIAIFDVAIKTLFTIAVFVLIKNPDDYWLYPAIFGTSYIVVSVCSHYFLLKQYNLVFGPFIFNDIRRNLRESFPLFVNQFAPNLYNNTTVFFTGLVLGNVAVGVLGAVRQIVSLLNVLNSVLTLTFFPYINRKTSEFGKYSALHFGVITAGAIFLITCKPLLFWIVGITGRDAAVVYFILMVGIWFLSLYSIYATNYLIVKGKDRLVMRNTLLISVCSVVVSWPIIKHGQLPGAAMVICFSQMLMGMTSMYYFYKFKN